MDSEVTLLPHPLSPTSPSTSPAVDREAHPVHRAEHALAGGEVGLQTFDGEKRRHPRP